MKGFLITRLAPREAGRSDHCCGDLVGCVSAGFGGTVPKHFDALSPKMMTRNAPEA